MCSLLIRFPREGKPHIEWNRSVGAWVMYDLNRTCFVIGIGLDDLSSALKSARALWVW
jgi:hypothetical protein